MKRVLSIAGIILVVALLAWPKVKGYFSNENKSSAPAARSASVLQVEAFIVKGDTVENNIFTTGTLLANEDVELSSESSGIVRDIYL